MWKRCGWTVGLLVMVFGCGGVQVDPDQALSRRGQNGAVIPAGAGGAGDPTPATSGAGGATPAPSAWSCAATPLPVPTATSDRPYVFMNFGGACTAGGGQCQAAAAAYDAAGSSPAYGVAHFAEACTADPPDPGGAAPALAGPGFCSSVLSPRPWDTSCGVLHAEQIPLGWICCTTAAAPAVLVPARCGCP